MKTFLWAGFITLLFGFCIALAFGQNSQGNDDAQGNEGGRPLPPPGCCIQ